MGKLKEINQELFNELLRVNGKIKLAVYSGRLGFEFNDDIHNIYVMNDDEVMIEMASIKSNSRFVIERSKDNYNYQYRFIDSDGNISALSSDVFVAKHSCIKHIEDLMQDIPGATIEDLTK